ncbi:putative membrane protein YccC [Stenotrophomonas maltophilia]|uniref:FUSC family protein n=1 Tax=Stenotrophomonas chelatiphaga TaxID=517011 RepID=UPI000F4B4B6C|nr:FUSC family protein [Stenotrophomonas chelatiphaga]MCS4232649.1 putative membrane protein YccC [Stenotrophomonas chelatiphaga]ROQ41944.1 putative membrane protein YccC [Stenotrophomonas maltophilia]
MHVLLDRQGWMFSIKTYLASITALYIGLAGNLSRPYWAMATVYIVSQPLLGPTRAKGVYRILGTLLAGAATLLMLPHLVETPLLLSAAMSLWLAGCLFMALLNRGPRGYAFLLAGYTTAFIGFPAVTSPELIFDTVVARSEEIILGTVVAVLFAALVFPASVRPMLTGRIGNWMGDAAHWCRQILEGGRAHAPRNRLAADLVQFEALIEFLRRDDPRHAGAAVSMQQLRERMLLLLPVLSSIADRLGALRRHGDGLPDGLESLVEDIRQWLEAPTESPTHDQLRARISALKPQVDGDLQHLQLASLLLRLEELVDLWADCRALHQAIEQGSAPRDASHYRISTRSVAESRHVDYGMALFSALSAGIALMSYCVLWIGLGWEGGGNGAMMAAVAAAFFAAQDDPAPSMMSFLVWAVVASVVAGIYLFGIFPAVHDFGLLVLLLAVVFLPLGVLLHHPKTMLFALPLTVNLVALLSVQNTYSANIQSFVNSAVAMFIGIGFAVVMTRLFRSVGAEWTARRLVRQGWTTLAEAAEGRGQQDRERFAARMLDLLGLLAPRLAATPEGSDIASVDMLTEARVGLNILQLRRARLELPERSREAVERILAEIAAHYRRQAAARRPLPGDGALRGRLDASLSRVGGVAACKARDEALMGLVGLRFALFPDAEG